MALLVVRRSLAIHPELLMETDRLDGEGVTFPVTDGVSVVARHEIFRMLATIHKDDAIGVRSADIHDEHALQFRHIDKLHTIRREKLARAARGLATRVGLKLILEPIIVNTLGPGLPRHFTDLGF